ncbi:MAG: hypothetical protein ABSB74_05335 [Tepidisphaeraceae bacterium]
MENKQRRIAKFGQFLAKSLRLRDVKVRIDWQRWLRLIQRKRRLLTRAASPRPKPLPDEYFATATLVSFRLEGIQIDEPDVASALALGQAHKTFRSRSSQRIRSHVAILHRIESALQRGASLSTPSVVRWYTSISGGLSLADLDESTMNRLDNVVHRINSPQFRLRPAIREITHLHAQLLADPLVPSFNGILSRLLLRYHLGRCGLPPVVFDPQSDEKLLNDEPRLLNRVLEMLNGSYDMMLAE